MTYQIGTREYHDSRDVHLGDVASDASTRAVWYREYFLPMQQEALNAALRQPAQVMDPVMQRINTARHHADAFLNTGNSDEATHTVGILRSVQAMIAAWDRAEPTLLDLIEEVIRNIPRNITDAAAFVGEQMAAIFSKGVGAAAAASPLFVATVVGGTALFAYYLFKKDRGPTLMQRIGRVFT